MKRLALCLMAFALPAGAVERIAVLGLFKDMAMVKIDGQVRRLRTGETSPEGVKLVGADSRAAVLEVNGRRDEYRLGQDVHGQFSLPERALVQVPRSPNGMYHTAGSINGQTVSFLIDTGATTVAMNEAVARRLGLDYRVGGAPMTVGTASGTARAWRIVLDRVKLGNIELANVEAAVIQGTGPGNEVLLGMSFLGRLKLRDTGQLLELESKL